VALGWRDVEFAGRKITVRQALSGDTELWSTKSRRFGRGPTLARAPPSATEQNSCRIVFNEH
jgi:hypothetical protein